MDCTQTRESHSVLSGLDTTSPNRNKITAIVLSSVSDPLQSCLRGQQYWPCFLGEVVTKHSADREIRTRLPLAISRRKTVGKQAWTEKPGRSVCRGLSLPYVAAMWSQSVKCIDNKNASTEGRDELSCGISMQKKGSTALYFERKTFDRVA